MDRLDKIKISLIVATLGRHAELNLLLESLVKQTYPKENFEVIIVDQNDIISIDGIVSTYSNLLNIKHIKSINKGVSLSRNIGIKLSKGFIVGFPDDDCIYYSDTLISVAKYFELNPMVEVVTGRLFDRELGIGIYRSWPNKERQLTRWNALFLYTAVTTFSRDKNLFFDDRLGPGTKFPSYEDADYIYVSVKKGLVTKYCPDIDVWHPSEVPLQVSSEKTWNYGVGFGGFTRKCSDAPIFLIFIGVIFYHLFKAVIHAILLDLSGIKGRLRSVFSRLYGFFIFPS